MKKKITKLTSLFLLQVMFILSNLYYLNAQPIIEWQKCLGGSDHDEANSVQQTKDEGYIVAGNTLSNDGDVSGNKGSNDFWIVKLSSIGFLEWQKCQGDFHSEIAYSVQQTKEGGYIIAGGIHSPGIDTAKIVKINSVGDVEWDTIIGRAGDSYARSVQQTTDNGYIIAGASTDSIEKDFWIFKLDSGGNMEWEKKYGGSKSERARSIRQTNDGGYIVAGESDSFDGDVTENQGEDDYWILKLDSIGNKIWGRTFGGSLSELPTSIQQTKDGGYIIAGSSQSNNGEVTGNHGQEDYWIVKLDSTGNKVWDRTFGGSLSDLATSIQQTVDGDYIVAGYSRSTDGDIIENHGNYDYWIVQLDEGGNIKWRTNLGGSGYDRTSSIQQTLDGGFIIAGSTFSNDDDVSGNHGGSDYWIVKLSPFVVGIKENTITTNIDIYPNPFHSTISIREESADPFERIEIINTSGITVNEYFHISNQEINLEFLKEGIYFIRFTKSGKSLIKKIVKM